MLAHSYHGHDAEQKLLVVDEPVLIVVERFEVLGAVLALGAHAGQQLGELGCRETLQQAWPCVCKLWALTCGGGNRSTPRTSAAPQPRQAGQEDHGRATGRPSAAATAAAAATGAGQGQGRRAGSQQAGHTSSSAGAADAKSALALLSTAAATVRLGASVTIGSSTASAPGSSP